VRILIPALASHHRLSAFHRNFATLFDSDRSLKRRATVGPQAFVFGSPDGAVVASFETAKSHSCWSRTGMTLDEPRLELGSIVRSCARSISIDTI
jgi:hypothetical protein